MKKIKVTFKGYKGNQAIFQTSEKEEIVFPASLVQGLKSESFFDISIRNEEEAKASDEKLAKIILNEILKP